MKKAEQRAFETGEVYAKGSNPMLSGDLDAIQPREGIKCNLFIHFVVPALIIVGWTLGTYFVIGSAKTLEGFVIAVLYQAIMISPVFSAIGINLTGLTRPLSGWFQRSRASSPTILPEEESICGW